MRKHSLVLPLAASFLLTGVASGAYSWSDHHEDYPNALDFLVEGIDESYSNTWTIDGPVAFDPSLHNITGIRVGFAFADDVPESDPDDWEHVDIEVGGNLLWDDLEVGGTHPEPTIPGSGYQWVWMEFDAGTNTTEFWNLRGELIENSGQLDYTVTLQNLKAITSDTYWSVEDTYLKETKIEVWGAEQVPDGGTSIALLGLSLLGLGGLRRTVTRRR